MKNFRIDRNRENISFIKNAHRFKDSIACLETSVRVCFWGKQSIYFSIFRNYFGIVGVFYIINCYFEYRIRNLRTWLYMGTWFKRFFDTFQKKKIQKCPRSVNNFRTDHFLKCFWILGPKWSPYVRFVTLATPRDDRLIIGRFKIIV